jgi:hypothetical protein
MSIASAAPQSGEDRPSLLGRLFPVRIDNKFPGSRLALWLFGVYVFVKVGQGGESLFNSAATAVRADGIPLQSFGTAAAETAVEMFALLGLNVLVLPLLGVIALIRYRAMIPLIYLMMLILNLSSRAVNYAHPSPRIGGVQPVGFYVNLGLLAILVIGFALSLANGTRAQMARAVPTR